MYHYINIYILTLSIFLMNVLCCQAQKGVNTITIQHTLSYPTGNTNDFISKATLRGIMVDYRYLAKPTLAVGLSAGWLTFYENRNQQTYIAVNETTSYSGKQYRYMNSVPIVFFGDYYFTPERTYSSFIGIGIGTTYNRLNNKLGAYDLRMPAWQFTVAPEAGFRFGYDFGLSGLISARYNQNLTTVCLSTQSYVSLNIGLMYRWGNAHGLSYRKTG